MTYAMNNHGLYYDYRFKPYNTISNFTSKFMNSKDKCYELRSFLNQLYENIHNAEPPVKIEKEIRRIKHHLYYIQKFEKAFKNLKDEESKCISKENDWRVRTFGESVHPNAEIFKKIPDGAKSFLELYNAKRPGFSDLAKSFSLSRPWDLRLRSTNSTAVPVQSESTSEQFLNQPRVERSSETLADENKKDDHVSFAKRIREKHFSVKGVESIS